MGGQPGLTCCVTIFKIEEFFWTFFRETEALEDEPEAKKRNRDASTIATCLVYNLKYFDWFLY